MARSRNLILVVSVLCALAVLLGLFSGPAYALVAVLVGAIVVAAVAIASKVASESDAPFSHDDGAALGDTTQHSDVSSAVEHAPR